MAELEKITTAPTLTFDALTAGQPGAPLVLLLHGWGDADDTVGRLAAEGTVDFFAAPYRFKVLPGVGHFAADQVPDRVNELLLQHVAVHPV
jgi:pimeloyl-ACP methyl ester carboxylesterase